MFADQLQKLRFWGMSVVFTIANFKFLRFLDHKGLCASIESSDLLGMSPVRRTDKKYR